MINQIKTYKENKIKKYIDDYPEMIAEYQRELETIKGYNGRQILELLQNCDDKSATNVKISLDTNAVLDFCYRTYPEDVFPQLWGVLHSFKLANTLSKRLSNKILSTSNDARLSILSSRAITKFSSSQLSNSSTVSITSFSVSLLTCSNSICF